MGESERRGKRTLRVAQSGTGLSLHQPQDRLGARPTRQLGAMESLGRTLPGADHSLRRSSAGDSAGKPIRVAWQSKRVPMLRVIDLGTPNERAPWPAAMK